MKKCLIITNYDKDENLSVTNHIKKYLMEHGGCQCVMPKQPFSGSEDWEDSEILEDVDVILVLGGDGKNSYGG